jgi:hypothetical protein
MRPTILIVTVLPAVAACGTCGRSLFDLSDLGEHV